MGVLGGHSVLYLTALLMVLAVAFSLSSPAVAKKFNIYGPKADKLYILILTTQEA